MKVSYSVAPGRPAPPLPRDRELLEALKRNGLFNAMSPGLHFGYGIYFRAGY